MRKNFNNLCCLKCSDIIQNAKILYYHAKINSAQTAESGLSTVASDALVLKRQAISIHSAD